MVMCIFLFLLWLILNGKVTLEICLFGVVITGAVYAFCVAALGCRPQAERRFLKRLGGYVVYGAILVREIIRANLAVMRVIWSRKPDYHPAIVRVHAPLEKPVSRMLLSNSILQAHGIVNLPVVIAAIGGLIKLGVNYTLVAVPSLNVVGAAIGTLCCFGAVACMDLFVIHRVVPAPPRLDRIFVKPLIASAIMAVAAWAFHGLLAKVLSLISVFQAVDKAGVVTGLSRIGNALATLGGIGIGVIVYLILIVALKTISREDLALMPKGDKLAKLLRL